MRKILYIGNKLDNSKSNISYITQLGSLLTNEGFHISFASSYTNKVIRLFDMIFSVIKHRNKVDYVLIDTYSTQNFYYALIVSQLSRFLKLKYYPILHGGNLPERLKISPKWSVKIFSNAVANIAPSMFMKDAFLKQGFTNVIYIPNTIKVKSFDYSIKPIQSIKILWVRSFSEIYNPKLAVLVLNKLLKQGIEAELCMVGPDSDGSLGEVKKLAQELRLKVTFTGKLPKTEWLNLAKDYNVFLNTTNFDNTPLSVIEAMAIGLPVVSTNVGGMPFLIENGVDGLLVKPDDVGEMTNAIVRLLNNDSLAKTMSKNARHKVEQFDWGKVKHQWIALLS